MYPISEHLTYFLSNLVANARGSASAGAGGYKATISEELIEEFGELCKQRIRETLQERTFSLRMSNIGQDVRQLYLKQEYGSDLDNPVAYIRMAYGHLTEALFVMLFKAAGIPLEIPTEKVTLTLPDGTEVNGLPDIKVNGDVIDIKSASPYSYDNKFKDYATLKSDDPFGYLGQGAGYGMAEDSPFGGWFVINKATGDFKDVPVGLDFNTPATRESYIQEFQYKADVLSGKLPVPECTNVEEETFYGKPTGNKVLGKGCRFCSHPEKCHPGSQVLPAVKSKAKNPTLTRYIGEVKGHE